MVIIAVFMTIHFNKTCCIKTAGVGIVLTVMALFLNVGLNGTSYYPSLYDMQSSLTIQNSSGSHYTLTTMSYVSLIVPFVLAYITYAWYQMDSLNNFVLIDSFQSIWIDSTAVIRVGVDNGCGLQFDIINIDVIWEPLKFLQDTVGTCANAPILLDAGEWGLGTTYSWSNGASTRKSLYTNLGNGSVTVSNQCGTISYNFFIRNAAQHNVNLGPDDTLCQDSVILRPGVNISMTDQVLWSTGSFENAITANLTSTYWVRVTNACGTFTDTINLIFLAKITKVDIPSPLPNTKQITILVTKAVSKYAELSISTPAFASANIGIIK